MTNKNFTRKDLVNKIFKKLGFSKNLSSRIVDDFFETLISEIIKLNKIKISSFGTFSILNKKKEWEEIQKQKLRLGFFPERS